MGDCARMFLAMSRRRRISIVCGCRRRSWKALIPEGNEVIPEFQPRVLVQNFSHKRLQQRPYNNGQPFPRTVVDGGEVREELAVDVRKSVRKACHDSDWDIREVVKPAFAPVDEHRRAHLEAQHGVAAEELDERKEQGRQVWNLGEEGAPMSEGAEGSLQPLDTPPGVQRENLCEIRVHRMIALDRKALVRLVIVRKIEQRLPYDPTLLIRECSARLEKAA